MKNKIILLTYFFIIVMFSFSSCSHPFLKDPRLYNSDNENINKPSDDPEFKPEDLDPSFISPFDKKEWYNNPDCNGDSTTPSKLGFQASEFDKAVIHASFDDRSIPSFELIMKDAWGTPTDTSYNEYTYKGPDTTAMNIGVKDVYYMQYRGINPCYSPDKEYNQILQKTAKGNPMLSRFYFYRFVAKKPVKLNNFLIAIDTYSKFVFQFAKPENPKDVIPQNWKGTDRELVDGKNCFFYQYDPIGYVTKNNDNTYSIVLYDFFKNNLANKVHDGTINPEHKEFAKKTPNGQGKSPFNKSADEIIDIKECVKGKKFSGRILENKKPAEFLFEFEFDETSETVTIKKTDWNNQSKPEVFKGDLYLVDGVNNKAKINVNNKEVPFVVSKAGSLISLSFGDSLTCVESSNFVDPTPCFEKKVNNNIFKNDSNISYKFENGYEKLIFNGKTYEANFNINLGDSKFHNFRMGYSRKDFIVMSYFIGVEIDKEGNIVKATDETKSILGLNKDVNWDSLGSPAVKSK